MYTFTYEYIATVLPAMSVMNIQPPALLLGNCSVGMSEGKGRCSLCCPACVACCYRQEEKPPSPNNDSYPHVKYSSPTNPQSDMLGRGVWPTAMCTNTCCAHVWSP